MKRTVLLDITKVECFETGHEIDSLDFLKGAKVLNVVDSGDERVELTVELASQKNRNATASTNKRVMARKPRPNRKATS